MRWWPLPWQSWPEFIVDNPWVVDAMEWLRFAKGLWDQYNSLIILVGLWLVARKLGRERERLEERVDTLGQHVKAAADASDAAIAAAKETAEVIVQAFATRTGNANGASAALTTSQSEASDTNWQRVNDIWSEIKERIDLKIQEIPHKRVRGKYSHMRRRTYEDILNALRKDRVLKPGIVVQLLTLDHLYQVLRFKPKDVTPEQAKLFEEGLQTVNGVGALPPLPIENELDKQVGGAAQEQTSAATEGSAVAGRHASAA